MLLGQAPRANHGSACWLPLLLLLRIYMPSLLVRIYLLLGSWQSSVTAAANLSVAGVHRLVVRLLLSLFLLYAERCRKSPGPQAWKVLVTSTGDP